MSESNANSPLPNDAPDTSSSGADSQPTDAELRVDPADAASEIAETIAGATNVENIEHIETVEITGEKLNAFMSHFPHLVVGIISIIALLGFIPIVISNFYGGKDGHVVDPAETARNLITYLVAVFTIVIALTLTLMAFFSHLEDFKERFALGKEVLTVLIGVLGTIIGFYFGSAEPENKQSPQASAQSAPSNSNAVPTNVNAASAASFTTALTAVNTNAGAAPTSEQKQFARAKEREGFESLIAGDYDAAISSFQASEDAWNSYHNTYDIARLLRRNRTQMDDPAKKREVFGIIANQFSYGAPPDLLAQVKTIADQ